MSLRHSYTLIAPFYDALLASATGGMRRQSLAQLPAAPSRVLLLGVGTGLDLPYLPPQHHYTGLDLTPAMLARAQRRGGSLPFSPLQGDAQALPLADGAFDVVVLHLILAVVPAPLDCLREAARVLRPRGQLLVLDKFLRPGQRAPLRRWLTPLSRHLATRLDVEWEPLLAAVPELILEDDQPALAGGWFRRIRARRLG